MRYERRHQEALGLRWACRYWLFRPIFFDQAALKSLYETMQPLRTDKKPFDQKVRFETATTWLIPKLVCEVKIHEWTSEGEMRHPVFLGLRIDKKAFDVVREQA